jgi:hypothetical protein
MGKLGKPSIVAKKSPGKVSWAEIHHLEGGGDKRELAKI